MMFNWNEYRQQILTRIRENRTAEAQYTLSIWRVERRGRKNREA
jgi:hypothetical protein